VKNIGPTHDTFSLSKVVLVSLFLSHLFPSLFTFCVEETASPKVYHPSLNWTTRTKLKLRGSTPGAMHCTCPYKPCSYWPFVGLNLAFGFEFISYKSTKINAFFSKVPMPI
jgi:hypothetical protein